MQLVYFFRSAFLLCLYVFHIRGMWCSQTSRNVMIELLSLTWTKTKMQLKNVMIDLFSLLLDRYECIYDTICNTSDLGFVSGFGIRIPNIFLHPLWPDNIIFTIIQAYYSKNSLHKPTRVLSACVVLIHMGY